MSNLDDDYADRLADLLEDMEGNGAEAYMYQFEDADMIIQLQEPEETTAARLH
ncbi:TPA: hypothetical protein QHC26_005318 [Enterobacter kobei]|nr:hypothetical protein [Enterobacter kobei]